MDHNSQYAAAASAFNALAPDYDAVYGADANPAMAWMRRESLALLREVFAPGSRLLELGCGTGEEAIALAQDGHAILATDVSPRMAALTRQKSLSAGLGERIQALALPAGSLSALRPGYLFDGAYASFGALNCDPDLPGVGAALARLVRPGGAFVASVMGRACLFEILWHLLHGQPRRAFRRLTGSEWQAVAVAGQRGAVTVATRYLSLKAMTRAFPAFRLERALALPLFLPAPYAGALFRRWAALINRLEPWEHRLRARRPWRTLGDHIVLVLRKPYSPSQ